MLLHAIPTVLLDTHSGFRPPLSVEKAYCVVLHPYGTVILTILRLRFT